LMGYSQQQIDQMQQFNYFTSRTMLVFMPLISLPFLGYLLYVKRYFGRTAESPQPR
jgi:hypothetical protein